MRPGEYIKTFGGRFGCWCDQLTITTNLGQTMTVGGQGGHDEPFPAADKNSMIIGIDTEHHNYLARCWLYCIDLD